jgi:hypothetical protein
VRARDVRQRRIGEARAAKGEGRGGHRGTP